MANAEGSTKSNRGRKPNPDRDNVTTGQPAIGIRLTTEEVEIVDEIVKQANEAMARLHIKPREPLKFQDVIRTWIDEWARKNNFIPRKYQQAMPAVSPTAPMPTAPAVTQPAPKSPEHQRQVLISLGFKPEQVEDIMAVQERAASQPERPQDSPQQAPEQAKVSATQQALPLPKNADKAAPKGKDKPKKVHPKSTPEKEAIRAAIMDIDNNEIIAATNVDRGYAYSWKNGNQCIPDSQMASLRALAKKHGKKV